MKKCIELWAGDSTGLSGVRVRMPGSRIVTVEIDPTFEPTICKDILEVTAQELREALDLEEGERPWMIWASPDCSVFSVAGFGRGHFKPKPEGGFEACSEKAQYMIERHKHTIDLIHALDPVYWVIENPVGLLRKMPWMKSFQRETVTYCQYGDFRMKPTDLWGQFPATWWPRARCKNGDPCHESSPRGSGNGTTKLSLRERSHIPIELSLEIFDASLESDGDTRYDLRRWIE